MSLRKYITSKVFLRQVAIALTLVVLLVVLVLNLLSFITNHGQEIIVPNLANMTMDQVEKKLEDLDLDYVVLDTIDYNEEFAKFGVVLQEPKPGSKVKENRKIYLKINNDSYAYVELPDMIEKTFRQVEPNLKVLGLELGEVTYKPYLGKDMVLEMRINGKLVKPGTKVMKTTKIDLVLGDGKIGFEEESQDSLQSNYDKE
ncbi:PASTA domain-containing protein [Flavobacterium orientale]|uniref:PASTA domain-containing protein n=1 Tax=Flavobacterium orientale TaxID=1756020 RepID=A0A916Y8W9_9FLAO|nr:PASTA domain-containing protein [Flavobacterium orientale]GGD34966.1 PASTA domain-containing protein [Flavobacterium orientale]